MKKNLWISALSTIFVAVLVLIYVLLIRTPDQTEENVIPDKEDSIFFKELVFEDEIDYQYLGKSNAKINGDLKNINSHDSTRIFEIDRITGSVTLPYVYLRITDLKTDEITYEPVGSKNLEFVNLKQVFFEGLTCYPNDYNADEIDNRMNIRINTEDKTLVDLKLPIRIIKKPIAVNSINIEFVDKSTRIGLTEEKMLQAEVLPYEATYQNYQYEIEKIEKPDGTLYSGDLSQYAAIIKSNLSTTSQIEIGSKIYISAITDRNQVKSNVLVIEVKRIDIERIDLTSDYYRNDINLGEELELNVIIYPENATINILKDSVIMVTLNDTISATLTKIDDRKYILKAIEEIANEGKVLKLTVDVENYSKNYFYQISSIPIESIVIYDKDTDMPLEHNITITRNSVLNLYAVITPVNASVKQARFNLASNVQNSSIFADIDSNGKLTISNNAPFGMELYLSATAHRKSSGAYKITVVQVPVESVTLSAPKSYIIKNTILNLNDYIYPENANVTSTEFKIINVPVGVSISGNRLFASSDSIVGTKIEIVMIVNGIESNVLSIQIVDSSE